MKMSHIHISGTFTVVLTEGGRYECMTTIGGSDTMRHGEGATPGEAIADSVNPNAPEESMKDIAARWSAGNVPDPDPRGEVQA
jgi:hypothetical protein